MRIALVTYALNVGGMETMLLAFAEELRARGHEVAFVLTEKAGAWHDRPRNAGFVQHDVLRSRWQSRYRHSLRLVRVLAQYEVVIFNHSADAQATVGLLPPATMTLAVLHNDLDSIYRIGLSNYAQLDAVVAVGRRVWTQARSLVSDPEKIVEIRNGVAVPAPPLPSSSAESAERPLQVLYIGRLSHSQKGILHLPEIIDRTVLAAPSVHFDIVGGGPDAGRLQAALAGQIAKEEVTLHGPLPHAEALALMASADVLIMPSYFEGQPITLFEGMIRGLAPVVSLLPGITDSVIRDGESGFLVAAGDVAGFSARIVQLACDRKLLRMISANARTFATEECTVKTMVDEYLRLISTLAAGRERGNFRSGRIATEELGFLHHLPYVIARNIERLFEKRH